jgi:alkylated DNA repair protein (DNA oxidative demethylase)
MANPPHKLEVAPGVWLWPEYFSASEQEGLVAEVFRLVQEAPFYRPRMPGSGAPFSVEETNFGSLGWLSDESGYRYAKRHPITHTGWPTMPQVLLDLWSAISCYPAPPECCLVNFYRSGARMGLHQDRDEGALDAPVVSVSLGDEAVFRIGGPTRRSPSKSVRLRSGDVLAFGGPARLAFHGIDRVIPKTSSRISDGGRLNLTLRRVTAPA